MEPASCRLAIAIATRATSGPRRRLLRRRAAGRRGAAGSDRFDNLTLLKCHGRLQDNHFLSLQARLDIERVAKIATDLDALKVDGAILPAERHPAALPVEGYLGRGPAPPCPGG